MAVKIVMPKLGMSMEEGTVVLWHKNKGDTVKKGEPVASVSSEKIENEVEAPADGQLIEVHAAVDEVVPVGKAIGYIGEPGEKVEPESHSAPAESETAAASSAVTAAPAEAERVTAKPAASGRLRVSPAAKKLARQKGIDLETVEGTGPQGRITKDDVLKAEGGDKGPGEKTGTSELAGNGAGSESADLPEPAVREITGIRKVISQRMHESMQNTAQLTIMRNADVTELMAFRKRMKSDLETVNMDLNVTFTNLLAKAVTLALLEHPDMNSAEIGGKLYEYRHVHLGIAAATEKGLVVPVVFNAHLKSLAHISGEIRDLGRKAKDGTLSSDDMKGSTFTVTNLGASGISFFTPVLNTPETGILGVGAVEEAAAFVDGCAVPVKKLPLSLTFDHRIIDGEPASRFLNKVISYLEHPYRLLV